MGKQNSEGTEVNIESYHMASKVIRVEEGISANR